MNLGNAFARRKQLAAEIQTWTNRLSYAGTDTKNYRTKDISKGKDFEPIPGTAKEYFRNYTIEECRTKIDELIKEDQNLALRISMTNQIAKAKMIDLEGNEVELSVPELLVLKNDIAPKIENALRVIPKQASGVEIVEKGDGFIKWRNITPQMKSEQTASEKGVATNQIIDFYNVQEVVDYGKSQREVFDEIDKVHKWMQRLKEAVNKANETVLAELK